VIIITKLFGWLFKDKTEQRERTPEEKALIARMLEQANYIASGKGLIDDKLPPPVIPERRKNPR
jgi:hypothetical protein